MKALPLAVSALILAFVSVFAITEWNGGIGDAERFIVQASSVDAAEEAVRQVGGTVTHELSLINAVGAELTATEREAVASADGVRRVYADRTVKTDTVLCSLAGSADLEFSGDGASWLVTNNGDQTAVLYGAVLFWPKQNEELERVRFGGVTLWSGEREGISAKLEFSRSGTGARSLAPGDSKYFEAEYDDREGKQEDYEIRLFFDRGCDVEYPVPPPLPFEGDSDLEAKRSYIASLTGADALHWQGITGEGVGVAIIDTGIWAKNGRASYLQQNGLGQDRIVAHYDAIKDKIRDGKLNSDKNGHGSHIASVLLSSRHKDSEYNGIAPGVDLIAVQAFDRDGLGSYADVIRALDWVVTRRADHNIRVINLSFSATPQSWYWDDPLNQAVMAAWREGLVVVASAGNAGPEPMSIGVPGNVPYIITVGALTDGVTPDDWTDDSLASFSSAGPTYEAFVKPDLVAPGGHIRGMMEQNNKIAVDYPAFHDGDAYYTMSGTSQATAIVSGAVALMLDAEPWLTPDIVKCRLIRSARFARTGTGAPAYSVFQQGTGMVDVEAAVSASQTGCANLGLDIDADLAGTAHFQVESARPGT